MRSPTAEDTMCALFCRHIPLSAAQNARLATATVGVLLAGEAQISKIARWLQQPISQVGREQFLRRLLDAPFMTQERVYQPLMRQMLASFDEPRWHVLIDRTTLQGYAAEWLVIALAFRGHALPLAWHVIDFGCTSAEEQLELWKTVLPLLEAAPAVIAHGDTEFGSVEAMQFFRTQGWDFILQQPANTGYRLPGTSQWSLLRDLPVTARSPVYLSDVEWTQQHRYGPLNLFAFYAPRQNSPESIRRDIRYCVTTLPIAHTLRCVGRRRWGIECCFKDYKSAGWNVDLSHVANFQRRDSLLILLSLVYIWVTCVGRWLCKQGHRAYIDAHARRQLSLFRIGWDWLIAQFRQGRAWPPIATLYA